MIKKDFFFLGFILFLFVMILQDLGQWLFSSSESNSLRLAQVEGCSFMFLFDACLHDAC